MAVGKAGIVVGLVVGVAFVAMFAGIANAGQTKASEPKPKPKAGKPSSSKETPVVPGKEDKTKGLTKAEQVSLQNDPLDLLAAWGQVSPHKEYVQAIATKLSSAGDTRASLATGRLGNWTGPVTYAALIDPEASVVRDPMQYTLDQIFEVGGASNFRSFKNWAAQFLLANNRKDDGDLLLQQLAAMPSE